MSEIKIISGFENLAEVAKLFEEYKAELNVDLSFQPADNSAENIFERYKEPAGKIFLAKVEEKFAGCIVFYKMADKNFCELKRLFVRPEFRGLKIGKNVWIGSNVSIMPGITIGDNSVIGAGSVVTNNIPENVVAFGVPCKVIREIGEKDKKFYYKNRKLDVWE